MRMLGEPKKNPDKMMQLLNKRLGGSKLSLFAGGRG